MLHSAFHISININPSSIHTAEMEPFGTAAGIIAVIQLADRVIVLYKHYLESTLDAPSDLRLIFVETSTRKATVDSLNFLVLCQHEPTPPDVPLSKDGPIEACRKTLEKLSELFPSDYTNESSGSTTQSKRRKVKATLTALAWPLKETKARKLLSELGQHKATISLALTADLR